MSYKSCCINVSIGYVMLWQCCAYALVRFRHKKHLVGLRKRSRFGFMYLTLSPQTQLKMSRGLFESVALTMPWAFIKTIEWFSNLQTVKRSGKLKSLAWHSFGLTTQPPEKRSHYKWIYLCKLNQFNNLRHWNGPLCSETEYQLGAKKYDYLILMTFSKSFRNPPSISISFISLSLIFAHSLNKPKV